MFKIGSKEICDMYVGTKKLCKAMIGSKEFFSPGNQYELPQYSESFTLRQFIDGHVPPDVKVLTIVNNLTQPSIGTGDLNGYVVVFINNGDILGTRSGSTAFIATSPVTLINNGWIKGAGGVGGSGTEASITLRAFDDKWMNCTHYDCVSAGSYCPRFYDTRTFRGGYRFSGWGSTCYDNPKIEWQSSDRWGDYYPVYKRDGAVFWGPGTTNLRVDWGDKTTWKSPGGIGGSGASFLTPTPTDGQPGGTGVKYEGHDDNGNITSGTLYGNPGGKGGDFGQPGETVAGGGDAGQPGYAIDGASFLTSASLFGNTIGTIK